MLSKKNFGKLEEQIEKLTNELNEHRRKSLADMNAKNEENTALNFRVEEYRNNIEILKQELEQKQQLIKQLGILNYSNRSVNVIGNNTAMEELRKKLRTIEDREQAQKYEIEEKVIKFCVTCFHINF